MRRAMMLAAIVAVGLGTYRPADAGFVRVVAQLTPTADFPVGTFFFVRSRETPSGNQLFQSNSSNGANFLLGQIDVIVDTFVEDLPPSEYTGQWAYFMGAYGGTYDNPDDVATLPPVPPSTPHTGLITSLAFDPPNGATFESVWGADEATILSAYDEYVYNFPGPGATPEERAAWQQAVEPLLTMIYSNTQLLLPWTGGAEGQFSMNGRLIRFSDPENIGTIRGEFQSAVPEPSSILMFMFAAGIWCVRRARTS
jgi:hypothetical protein